jgi:hypothetical protein
MPVDVTHKWCRRDRFLMVAQSNAMNKLTTFTAIPTRALKLEALSNIAASFELFCLASGVKALGETMDHAAQAICGPAMREVVTGRGTAGENEGQDRRPRRRGRNRSAKA